MSVQTARIGDDLTIWEVRDNFTESPGDERHLDKARPGA